VSAKPPALEEPACFSQRTQRTEETTARLTLGDREADLRPINDELDGHQCTNWESVRCWYRTMDSLERR
jgi:hypothetical protein